MISLCSVVIDVVVVVVLVSVPIMKEIIMCMSNDGKMGMMMRLIMVLMMKMNSGYMSVTDGARCLCLLFVYQVVAAVTHKRDDGDGMYVKVVYNVELIENGYS